VSASGRIDVDPDPVAARRREAARPLAVLAVVVGLVAVGVWLFSPHGSSAGRSPLAMSRPTAYDQPPIVVSVFEYGFTPRRLVILSGQLVTWRDVGKQFHLIRPLTSAGRRVFAEAERLGSANQLFRKPGRYPYYCSIHPWMRGVVIVRRRAHV
jgi:plastocyanin